jgi:hypothetical protein
MSTAINPFNFESPADRWTFTDREELLPVLRQAMGERGRRLLLHGRRRMGKTTVIKNAARLAKVPFLYVDLAAAASLTEVASKLLQAIPQPREAAATKILGLIQRHFKNLTFSAHGYFSLGGDFRDKEAAANLDDVLNFINARADITDELVTLCFDEFQDLRTLAGDRAEWRLRGVIQEHRNLNYIFSGSDHRLLEWMTEPNAAFFKQVQPIHVGPIAADLLGGWIDARARMGGLQGAAWGKDVVALAGPCTGDVVRLAKTVFDFHAAKRGARAVTEAFDAIALVDLRDECVGRWHQCSPAQRGVLRALALGKAPRAADTLAAFGIRSASTAQSAIDALFDKQILTRDGERLIFDNPFFQRWVEANAPEPKPPPAP